MCSRSSRSRSKGFAVAAAVWLFLPGAPLRSAWAAAVEYPLTEPIAAPMSFGQVRYRPGDKVLTVRLTSGDASSTVPIPFLADTAEPGFARVLVDDFDFDGAPDLMTPVSTGYGGVNWFYTLYRFDRASSRFVAVAAADGEAEFCNPVARPAEKVLVTPCKSGPAWLDDAYKFTADGRPYKFRENELVGLRGFEGDASVVYVRRYRDADGRVTKTEVLDPGDEKPAVRKIPQERVYLHASPDEASPTAGYIIRDDVVELLDVAERPGQRQWLQVAYQSVRAGRLVRWIALE